MTPRVPKALESAESAGVFLLPANAHDHGSLKGRCRSFLVDGQVPDAQFVNHVLDLDLSTV